MEMPGAMCLRLNVRFAGLGFGATGCSVGSGADLGWQAAGRGFCAGLGVLRSIPARRTCRRSFLRFPSSCTALKLHALGYTGAQLLLGVLSVQELLEQASEFAPLNPKGPHTRASHNAATRRA